MNNCATSLACRNPAIQLTTETVWHGTLLNVIIWDMVSTIEVPLRGTVEVWLLFFLFTLYQSLIKHEVIYYEFSHIDHPEINPPGSGGGVFVSSACMPP